MYTLNEIIKTKKTHVCGSNEWKNEMAELLMVLSPRGTTLDDINQLITFFESHDTYLNIDNNHSHTRDLTDHDLTYVYRKLRQLYNNTLVYVRPNDEDKCYCRNLDGLSCDQVYKLDEREWFNRLYFDSSKIRDINEFDRENPKYSMVVNGLSRNEVEKRMFGSYRKTQNFRRRYFYRR